MVARRSWGRCDVIDKQTWAAATQDMAIITYDQVMAFTPAATNIKHMDTGQAHDSHPGKSLLIFNFTNGVKNLQSRMYVSFQVAGYTLHTYI